MNLDDIESQNTLLADWEETDDGIRADISTDVGRITTEVTFNDDGSISEELTVLDDGTDEIVTEEVEYDWGTVQRGFLKEILRDLTDRAGGSRRVRLTGSEASAITSAAEKVAEVYSDDLNPDAIEDIHNGCDRIRDAFENDPKPRVDNEVRQPGGHTDGE